MNIEKLKELINKPAPQEIVRGFEITKRQGWPTGLRYEPSELGVKQAAADVRWLRDRHPNDNYELRALVSISREGAEERLQKQLEAAETVDTTGVEPSTKAVTKIPDIDPGILMEMNFAENQQAAAEAEAAAAAQEANGTE